MTDLGWVKVTNRANHFKQQSWYDEKRKWRLERVKLGPERLVWERLKGLWIQNQDNARRALRRDWANSKNVERCIRWCELTKLKTKTRLGEFNSLTVRRDLVCKDRRRRS